MKKFSLFSIILMYGFYISFAQNGHTVEDGVSAVGFSGGGIVIKDMPKKKGKSEGTVYLSNDWNVGNILLENEKALIDHQFNYNLQSHQLEIKDDEGDIRVLNFGAVKNFAWQSKKGPEYYEPCTIYDKNMPGFFKVLNSEGKAKFLVKPSLEIIYANHNPAMDAGKNHDTYTVSYDYYIYNGGKLIKVRKRKNSILSALKDKKEEVKNYAKENKLRFKDEKDIAKMVDYYNELN